MIIPPAAIKDHNFIDDNNGYGYNDELQRCFKCSKCNVFIMIPYDVNYYMGLLINNYIGTSLDLSKIESQGFFYFFSDSSWEDSLAINNLSCQDLIIKGIIE
jgi:hypothetical protein